MAVWITSDQHFGHGNIIKYTNRPFSSVEEMDAELTKRWNSVVSFDDEVYHLGDFTLFDYKAFSKYRMSLNGFIHFITGGHDDHWLSGYNKYGKKSAFKLDILPQLLIKKFFGERITLCHYPLLSWEQSHYGSIHFHGHTHGTIPILGSSGDLQLPPKEFGGRVGIRYDVGVDGNNYYPYNLEELLDQLRNHEDG